MGFGELRGTATSLTYIRLEDRATLDIDPENPGFNRVYIGAGESKVLPWASIRQYKTKTFVVRPHGMTGTFFIVTGLSGTSRNDATGTYYQSRIGVGSYTLQTFTEQVGYVRAGFRASAVGSLTLSAMFQT